jgi:membrane-bound lytic murein transglycosylase B
MAISRLGRRGFLTAPFAAVPLLRGLPVVAATGDFQAFLAEMRREALARGIGPDTVDMALRRAQYLPHVIELDRRQPEHVMTFAEYLAKAVPPERQQEARQHLRDYRPLLDAVRQRYRVEPQLVVALWGIESDFGKITGNYPVVDSLATLGYDGRRSSYFRAELIAALRILDRGDIELPRMMGSWAGAMGQCQFMPSTFLGYAVDFNGSGRRDIWSDHADVLASIANFIGHLGWREGEGWGLEVLLPGGFDAALAGIDNGARSMAQWSQLGVRSLDEQPLPPSMRPTSLVLPDGPGGQAFLVTDNFRVIMRWNKSVFFAAAVGCLADSMGAA